MSIEMFNQWRADYRSGKMTYKDHVAFANKCAQLFPEQTHFNLDLCADYLKTYKSKRILELGCWKGELARVILSMDQDICIWAGVDLLTGASQVLDPRFAYHQPLRFLWQCPVVTIYDTFVATHTIEHLLWSDLQKLIDWIKASKFKYLYLEAPIAEDKTWHNYMGSHILEVGWRQIYAAIGVEPDYVRGDCRGFTLQRPDLFEV